jgi:hypothetical protein
MRLIASAMALALVSSLPAQNRVETFPYPDGTIIPGWTAQWNTWKILNKRLIPTGGRTFHYITNNFFKGVKDCVIDVEVIYPKVVNLHYGGVCARHPGGTGENGLVMTKLQDNSSVGTGSFNRTYLYERPGGATSAATPPTKHAVVRMFVKGNTGWFEIDGNMDGIFEQKSAVRTFSNTATKKSGLTGICGYNGAEMDNWKLFLAQMTPDAATKPAIGTTYKMNFESPLHGGTTPRPTPYLALLSAGNKGFALTHGIHIPLTFDSLLVNSLAFGWSGVLTAKAPKGTISLAIPNMKSLVGLKLFSAGITLGSGTTGGWGNVSNDHGFIVQ